MYRDGLLSVPFLALVLAISMSLVLCDNLVQRLTLSFFTAALLSVLSLIVLSIKGRLTGPTVFILVVAAVTIPIGIDIILQDLGSGLTVPLLFSRRTVVTFLIVALPLSAWILAHEHLSAVEQDHALMRIVARHSDRLRPTACFSHRSPLIVRELKIPVGKRHVPQRSLRPPSEVGIISPNTPRFSSPHPELTFLK